MPIRITGMNSGLDTEALVSELVSAYKAKGDKYTKAQAKISWKQEAWKTMSSKTYSFRNSLDKMRFSSAYNLKTTSVSNSSKVSISAGNNAVNGTQSLNITSLAKAGYLTGGKLEREDGKKAAKDTTLESLGFRGEGKINLNGKAITLSGNMTVSDAVSKFEDAGVNVSFDETNQRIFVSAKESGKDNDFSLSALNKDGAMALKSLGLYVKSSSNSDIYSKYAKYSGKDIEGLLQQYNENASLVKDAESTKVYLLKALDYANAKKTLNDVNDKLKVLSDNHKALAENLLSNENTLVTADGKTFTYHKTADGEYYTDDSEVVGVDGDKTKYYRHTDSPVFLSTSKTYDPADLNNIQVQTADDYLETKFSITKEESNGYRVAPSKIESMEKIVQNEQADKDAARKNAEDAGETYVDPSTQGVYQEYRSFESVKLLVDNGMGVDELKSVQSQIESEKSTAQQALQEDSILENYAKQYSVATDATTKDMVVQTLNEYIQYAKDITDVDDGAIGYNTDAARINGQDATIYLNGARFTSTSNSFSINGLTINALGTTTTEDRIKNGLADEDAITVTTTTDNQSIYDKIKDFLSEYNSLINSMTSSYNAENASSYEPLTEEEKESMTDSEIEKWEEKGKSGILRRDSTLSTLMSALTSAMSKSYTINGKSYALSSFGIKTLGIMNAEKNEQNAYHIDGDADDESTSGNTDKLMAAIIADPDGVTEFFQKLSSDLYDSLGKNMSSTTLRSYGKFYNDKELEKQYKSYSTTISDWESKIADIEDRYYKKFAAMESALSKLQSQTQQLSGLLGM